MAAPYLRKVLHFRLEAAPSILQSPPSAIARKASNDAGFRVVQGGLIGLSDTVDLVAKEVSRTNLELLEALTVAPFRQCL